MYRMVRKQVFLCNICNYLCTEHISMYQHFATHMRRPYNCHKCSLHFCDSFNFYQHLSTHSNITYKCERCHLLIDICVDLGKHITVCIASKALRLRLFTCMHCNVTFTNFTLLPEKEAVKHIPSYTCVSCSSIDLIKK